MKIHLRQIPAEGLHLSGEEECLLPQLDPKEVRCAGPMHYELEVGISNGSLWANGKLIQPVELHCVRCLTAFPYEIEVSDFALHTELLGPEEIDLTPFMREDILLNLPAYPHCDREGGRVCEAALQPISPAADEEQKKRERDWRVLDGLKVRDS